MWFVGCTGCTLQTLYAWLVRGLYVGMVGIFIYRVLRLSLRFKELGLVFTELGRPFVLRSDNGPCYSSRECHNFLSFYQVDHITSSPHYPQSNGFAEALVGIAKKLMEKSVKEGKLWNYGLLQYRTTPSVLLFHHHWRCWQEEDHIQAFHNFHPVMARSWIPPEFDKSCLGGSLTTPLPQEPWIWSLDNLSLSRRWMEMFGEQPLLTNQQLSQIPIGWDFQTIPYWEGPGWWSSQGLYLLILSFRLKHNRGTLKEKPTHILVNPSVSWMDNQCCLLHQWWVWPIQRQLIGASKSVKHPILSIPLKHPSFMREEPYLVFLKLQHQDVQLDSIKVFLQFITLHPGSEWIKMMFCVCKFCSGEWSGY